MRKETALKSLLKFIFIFILFSQSISLSLRAQPAQRENNALNSPQKLYNEQTRYNHSANDSNFSIKEVVEKSEQILIVTSKEWNSPAGSMVCYERVNGRMLMMGDSIPVSLGRSGLGWGKGLTEFLNSEGPVKHEGDGRSPAGIFNLSFSFGYLPKDSLGWLNYPYKQVTAMTECVDDTASVHYNKIVETDGTAKTWKSSEKMRGYGQYYKFGIFVEHNSNPTSPGCGSCIFIHVWGGAGKTTSGCTAMSEERIVKLLRWLSAEKKPILIQLPEKEYDAIKPDLGL